MLRFLPKLLLVATAFAPILLTYAAVSMYKAPWDEKLKEAWFPILLVIVSVSVCVWVMNRAAKELPKNSVTIKSIKPADKELIGFVLAYLLPLMRGTLFEGPGLVVGSIIFFVVVMTSNAYHTNPLLGILRWHFYEIVIEEVTYILVTKRHIHNVKSVSSVVSLTDYMLLDTTK